MKIIDFTARKAKVRQYDQRVSDALVAFKSGRIGTAEAIDQLMNIGLDICDDPSVIREDAVYLLEERIPGAFETLGYDIQSLMRAVEKTCAGEVNAF